MRVTTEATFIKLSDPTEGKIRDATTGERWPDRYNVALMVGDDVISAFTNDDEVAMFLGKFSKLDTLLVEVDITGRRNNPDGLLNVRVTNAWDLEEPEAKK